MTFGLSKKILCFMMASAQLVSYRPKFIFKCMQGRYSAQLLLHLHAPISVCCLNAAWEVDTVYEPIKSFITRKLKLQSRSKKDDASRDLYPLKLDTSIKDFQVIIWEFLQHCSSLSCLVYCMGNIIKYRFLFGIQWELFLG